MFRVLLTLLAPPAQATDVPVSIDQDTTWSAAGSPWVLAEDTVVGGEVTLTVEPGAVVALAEGVDLRVQGVLVARGTAEAPVTFEGHDGAAWGSVILEGVDTRYEGLDTWVSGPVLEHCRFTGGSQALRIVGGSPLVRACTFEGNAYDPPPPDVVGGAALLVTDGSTARVQACAFTGNRTGGYGYGGAVYVDDASPIFQDCVFSDNEGAYGGALATNLMYSPVVGCTFTGNESASDGGAASFVSSSLAFLDNEVTGNASLLDGGGVHVCVECNPHAMPVFMDNVFADNVVYVQGGGGVGAAYLAGFTGNDLEGNETAGEASAFAWANVLDDVEPDRVEHVKLPGNWWGTSDPTDLADLIFDGADDPTLGTVTADPVATGPVAAPTTRVALTGRRFEYTEPGEEMAVHLTLYNPGAARDVDLALVVQVEGGAAMYWRDDIGFPDAEPGFETRRLSLPAGSVFHTRLTAPPWVGTGPTYTEWHAILTDPGSGAVIGTPVSLRVDLGGA